MTILCVVGARPNFMKAAPVIDKLKTIPGMTVRLIHTGQHYDARMSGLFFDELGLPRPDFDLQVGSASHAMQTGQIMIRFEPVLKEERPDLVIVFGDINSTVATALCAAKLGIRVAHVEAGLRSFDRTMPEELNRILTDQLSDFLFITERSAQENLRREGIPEEKIFFVGNVMVDTLLKHRDHARSLGVGAKFGLVPGSYGVLTLHRPANVDDPDTLTNILDTVNLLAERIPIVFPCHPRTRRQLSMPKFSNVIDLRVGEGTGDNGLRVTEPLGYLEFLSLMLGAALIDEPLFEAWKKFAGPTYRVSNMAGYYIIGIFCSVVSITVFCFLIGFRSFPFSAKYLLPIGCSSLFSYTLGNVFLNLFGSFARQFHPLLFLFLFFSCVLFFTIIKRRLPFYGVISDILNFGHNKELQRPNR